MAAAERRGLPRLLRRAGRDVSEERALGTGRRARGADGAAAARALPGARRWQVAGRILDRGERQESRTQGRDGAAAAAGSTAQRRARGVGKGTRSMTKIA